MAETRRHGPLDPERQSASQSARHRRPRLRDRKLVDRDQAMTHPEFRQKLEAVGYGVFVPVFFVATGVRFELNAQFASPTNLARVPVFLAALFIARGLPALVYRSLTTRTQTLAAALLQATSLSILIVAGQIGVQLDLLRPAVYAALV
ncbi:MAG TPA: cation:proton antiporter, partial [Gaiellaceae bacterium]|nr:cation:proton antiporter [Gaiellaceae bacterium]